MDTDDTLGGEVDPLLKRPRLLIAALLAMLASLAALIAHSPAPAAAAPPQPAIDASAASATSFGDAVPNEKFVHEFQHQVIQQLQSTLNQASKEQDERLQRFEQQQTQRLHDQTDALQRTVDAMQSRLVDPTGDLAGAPHVNARRMSDGPARTATPPIEEARAPEPKPLSIPLSDQLDPSSSQFARTKASGANLSPHGFVEGRLLNGVVAIVGGPERESIVALTGRYEAANGFATDLNGCFALVQGRPELPAGRIDFKVSRLTCNFPDGASKTWDVAGWLVDPDGIRGVRAEIVQNAGRKAIVAAAGGALSGFGRHLSQQQYEFSAGPIASSSTFIGNSSHDAIGSSADGAANALEQSIADYYNLYAPSLQVGGGTMVSLVIANELKFPPSGRLSTQTHSAIP